MSQNNEARKENRGTGTVSYWGRTALFAFAVAVGLISIVGRPFIRQDEPRVAGIAWEMALEKEYALPRLNGTPFLEYPSLGYLPTVILFKVTGKNTPFVGHLSMVLMGVGSVWVTFLLGRLLGGEMLGLRAAFALQAALGFIDLNSRLRVDAALLFWITFSLYGFVCGYYRKSFAGYSLFYLGMAGSFLTKGLIGIGLPAVVAAAFILCRKDMGTILRLRPWWGFLILALPIGIWSYGIYRTQGAHLLWEVWRQSLERFFSPSADHRESPFYYFDVVLSTAFPWTIFLPFVLWRSFAPPKWNKGYNLGENSLLPKVWFAGVFIALSLASSKRHVYLAPILPAFSLLLALWWEHREGMVERKLTQCLPYLYPLFPAVASAIAYVKGKFLLGCCLIAVTIAIGALVKRGGSLKQSMGFFIACSLILAIAIHFTIIVPKSWERSLQPFFDALPQQQKGREIFLFRPGESVRGAAYLHLSRRVPVVSTEDELRARLALDSNILIIAGSRDLEQFSPRLETVLVRTMPRYTLLLLAPSLPGEKMGQNHE